MKANITFSKEITIEEARRLLNGEGMCYPSTEHNKQMIAKATKEFIESLRNK